MIVSAPALDLPFSQFFSPYFYAPPLDGWLLRSHWDGEPQDMIPLYVVEHNLKTVGAIKARGDQSQLDLSIFRIFQVTNVLIDYKSPAFLDGTRSYGCAKRIHEKNYFCSSSRFGYNLQPDVWGYILA